ncbi:MAG: M48 family metalloprotease [bacterium]|nr:MAG: M48 family metalloprotease [bacterium]
MNKFFINLGRKLGTTVNRGKWYYKSLFGSEDEAIEAEYVLGKTLAANISREMKIHGDPSLQNLLDEIGAKLIAKVVNKNRKFKFQVIATKDINAFALPGGFIFVTAPLLNKIEFNRDEIAYILAHEIMHVVLKHPINRILTDYSAQVIFNIFLKGGTIGLIAKQLIGSLLRSSYSQENEFEADNYAVRLMNSTGFDPLASQSVLKKLATRSPEDTPIYNYFLSHPSVKERIEKIDKVLARRET